jgi:hypothetical protein
MERVIRWRIEGRTQAEHPDPMPLGKSGYQLKRRASAAGWCLWSRHMWQQKQQSSRVMIDSREGRRFLPARARFRRHHRYQGSKFEHGEGPFGLAARTATVGVSDNTGGMPNQGQGIYQDRK